MATVRPTVSPSDATALRTALKAFDGVLARQFALGRIWYEADVEHALIQHLNSALSDHDPSWLIGAEHKLYTSGRRPDIVCYRAKNYRKLVRVPEFHIVGVIEIKFGCPLGGDLEKLRAMQDDDHLPEGMLTWMVYGDHFSPKIHRTWARAHRVRAEAIAKWEKENHDLRGSTVLRCGKVPAHSPAAIDKARLDALKSEWFWRSD